MPLYFAYGANMDVLGMSGRCPASKALGPARLARHRFIVTKSGYASVMRSPFSDVHGVLWDLALSDIRALDRFEAIDGGLYCKLHQPVIVAGAPRRAMLYVATCSEPGVPKPGYMENIVTSAEAWELPANYIADLSRYLPGGKARSTDGRRRRA